MTQSEVALNAQLPWRHRSGDSDAPVLANLGAE
jgi:hypothetical protein